MRLAVVHKDLCNIQKCGTECILYCPRVRTGDETISIDENEKAFVSEELCVGCGICVKKCPFEAIDIITLPEELEYPTHPVRTVSSCTACLLPFREKLPVFSVRTVSESPPP